MTHSWISLVLWESFLGGLEELDEFFDVLADQGVWIQHIFLKKYFITWSGPFKSHIRDQNGGGGVQKQKFYRKV